MDKNKIELSKIDPIYLLFKTNLFVKVTAAHHYKSSNCDLTYEQFEVLNILCMKDGISQRNLAQIAIKDRSNITRILIILEKKGFIRREVDLNKNRVVKKVYITEDGKDQIEQILPGLQEFRLKTFKGISDEQVENFIVILEMIRNNLKDDFKLQI